MSGQFAMSLICSHFGALGVGLSLGGLMLTSSSHGGPVWGLIISCAALLFGLWGAAIGAPKETPDDR